MAGQTEEFVEGLASATKAEAKRIVEESAHALSRGEPVDLSVPEGLYALGEDDEEELDMPDEFDPKKSMGRIKAVMAARDELNSTVLEAQDQIRKSTADIAKAKKDLPRLKGVLETKTSELEGATKSQGVLETRLNRLKSEETPDTAALESAEKDYADQSHRVSQLGDAVRKAQSDVDGVEESTEEHQEKIDEAQKTLKKSKDPLKVHNDALTRMVAYHTGMVHLTAHLSDPTRLSKGTTEKDAPTEEDNTTVDDKVRERAVQDYRNLPDHVVKERISRAESRVEEINKALGETSDGPDGGAYRTNTPSPSKAKLMEERSVLENDLLAAKFVDITSSDSSGGDRATELIRQFKNLGVNDPHIQTLLKHGITGEGGRTAVHNLVQRMDDEDLGELAGEDGKDIAERLSELDPRLHGASARRKELRAALIDQMLYSEGAFDEDEDGGEKGLTSMVENKVDAAREILEQNPEKATNSWWNKFWGSVLKDPRLDVPTATKTYSIKDILRNLKTIPVNAWKGVQGKLTRKPGKAAAPHPSRVVARFLAYSKQVG